MEDLYLLFKMAEEDARAVYNETNKAVKYAHDMADIRANYNSTIPSCAAKAGISKSQWDAINSADKDTLDYNNLSPLDIQKVKDQSDNDEMLYKQAIEGVISSAKIASDAVITAAEYVYLYTYLNKIAIAKEEAYINTTIIHKDNRSTIKNKK